MKPHLRQRATQLRKKGWSYNMIARKLTVSKSTLSHWLREISYTPSREVQRRVNRALLNFVMSTHKKKIESIAVAANRAKGEIGPLSIRDLFMLGIGIYIGEGSKLYEQTRIINSDPDVVRLAMKWFKDICKVPIKNFSIAVHLYPDVSQREAVLYWSRITGIPHAHFEKIQTDTRTNKSQKKKRKLPYGTVHIKVRACGEKEFGVLLHRRILAWIREVYKQTRD